MQPEISSAKTSNAESEPCQNITQTICFPVEKKNILFAPQVNIPPEFLTSTPHLNFPFVADWWHSAPRDSQVYLAQDTATWVKQEWPESE